MVFRILYSVCFFGIGMGRLGLKANTIMIMIV